MRCRSTTRSSDRGFAAVVAIFLLVVVAGLGSALVTIAVTSNRNQASDWLGALAYQAAQTGLEYGIYQTSQGLWCTGAGGAQSVTIAMPGNLSPFSVTIACTPSSHTVSGASVNIWNLTSTACNQSTCPGNATPSYIERQLRTTITSN